MKALVRYKSEPGSMEIQEVPTPTLDENDETHAILKVEATGICGRDLEHFKEKLERVPMIPGHEYAGTIIELPHNNYTKWDLGDRVAAETVASVCGACSSCNDGFYNLCKKRKKIGEGETGAFASYIKVPLAYLHKIPESMTFEEAAMIEPTCVCYNAVMVNSNVEPGSIVVVIGAGAIGILCAQMAKLKKAKVVLIGLPEDAYRLNIGKSLGVDYIINTSQNPENKVLELTNQNGAPLVIDTVGGSPKTIESALQMVRPRGQITKIGWFMEFKDSNVKLDTLVRKNVRLQGSFSHTWPMWETCIELVKDKKINLKSMISDILPLEKWKDGFNLCFERKALKVILKPE